MLTTAKFGNRRRILAVLCLFPVSLAAWAHHSAAVVYDLQTEIVLENATVLEWRFVNPHAQLVFEAAGSDGERVEWIASSGNLIALRRSGVDENSFVAGQTFTVTGNPARDGSPTIEAHHVTLADGTEIPLIPRLIQAARASTADTSVEARRLSVSESVPGSSLTGGVWRFVSGPLPEELRSLAPDGIMLMEAYGQAPELNPGESAAYPLTEAGRNYQSRWKLAGNECAPPSPWVGTMAPYRIEFEEERSGRIHMRYEYMDQERTIWMDGRAHPPAERVPRSLQGHSTGYWDDDTLVVETTNMVANQVTRNGIYHSGEALITERYLRDGDRLVIVRVLEDPQYFTEPIVEVLVREFEPGGEILVYGDCVPQIPGSRG